MDNRSDDLEIDGFGAEQIRGRLSNVEIHLAATDIEVDIASAFRLPLDQVAALGVGLGSLPTMFRSITTTINMPTLLQATDKTGNLLDISRLNKSVGGLIGSYNEPGLGLQQARFHQIGSGSIQSVATMPYDPTMLFMAAALAQINQKLDAIQDTVNEMFEYMRQKDKAELRGNVKTLEDVLEAYRYNWNNDIWRKNAHMKVVDIKQESEQAIIHFRAQIGILIFDLLQDASRLPGNEYPHDMLRQLNNLFDRSYGSYFIKILLLWIFSFQIFLCYHENLLIFYQSLLDRRY